MKKTAFKSIVNLCLMLVLFAAMLVPANAAENDGASVKIVSYTRGEVTDIRSSELMQAVVTGYNGDASKLTYTWTNSLGTYLYVYNSHNMHNIRNTSGEIEISFNSKSGNNTGGGKGFAWAAVYGANLKESQLKGAITVTVTDASGNVIGTDTYSHGFKWHDLETDMSYSSFGLFVGESENVLDLLGKSAIIHVDCVESFIDEGFVVSGGDHIELSKKNGDYYIAGTSKGKAMVSIKLQKGNCKFHQKTYGYADTYVYVFKKPTIASTDTTLILSNLDPDCDYFIGSTRGVVEDGTVVFSGLKPNTAYTITVRGEKDGEHFNKYVYTYIQGITDEPIPAYNGSVITQLNDTPVNINKIFGEGSALYLKNASIPDSADISFGDNTASGIYTATLPAGNYDVYLKSGNDYTEIPGAGFAVTEEGWQNAINYYTVSYETDGQFPDGTTVMQEIYREGQNVSAMTETPEKEKHRFDGWAIDENRYFANDMVSENITEPITLTAVWTRKPDYTIQIDVANGSHDAAAPMVTVTEGDSFQISFSSNSGYIFESVMVDGRRAELTDNKFCFSNVISNHTISVTYTADQNNDLIPDKYQKNVVFKVVNGSFENEQTELTVPVTFTDKDGKWSETGSAVVVVPTGMKPDKGYTDTGAWNQALGETIVVSGKEEYTYTFSEKQRFTITASVENGTSSIKNTTVEYGSNAEVKFSGYSGYKLGSVLVNGMPVTLTDGIFTFSFIECDQAISVTYVKDETQTKQVYYTVKTFVDGLETAEERFYENVWVGETRPMLIVTADSIAVQEHVGYRFSHMTANIVAGAQVEHESVIEMFYEKDLDQTQKTWYEARSIIDGQVVDSEKYYDTAWINDANPLITITTASVKPVTPNGYILDTISPDVKAGDKVSSGSQIDMYYIEDTTQTKTVFYTVTVLAEDKPAETTEYSAVVWVNAEDEIPIQPDSLNHMPGPGYELVSTPDIKEGDVVASETNIVLEYRKASYKYQIQYFFDGTHDTAETHTGEGIYGSVIEDDVVKTYPGYAIDVVEGLPITITDNVDKNVAKVYYSTDANADGVPDKYQATVTYNIENGAWADGGTDSIQKIFSLMQKINGTWEPTVATLGDTIPIDMIPNAGFLPEGFWNVTIEEATVVTQTIEYVYGFSTVPVYKITANVVNGSHNMGADNATVPQGGRLEINITPDNGYMIESTTVNGENIVVQEGKIVLDNVIDDCVVDVICAEDANSDLVPDKYQKQITFRVVHGIWRDKKPGTERNDITILVTLVDENGNWSEDGKAKLSIPTASPDVGYEHGKWNIIPSDKVEKGGAELYVLTFYPPEETVTPQTGDEFSLVEYAATLVISLAGMLGMAWQKNNSV